MQKIIKNVSEVLSADKMDITIEFLVQKYYIRINYRVIKNKKKHLRGCFVIGSKEPSLRKQNEAKTKVPEGSLRNLGCGNRRCGRFG